MIRLPSSRPKVEGARSGVGDAGLRVQGSGWRVQLRPVPCGDCGGNFLTSFRICIYAPHASGGRITEISPAAPIQLLQAGMSFTQQMSVPVEITLRTTPDGIRMYRNPVKAIENLCNIL